MHITTEDVYHRLKGRQGERIRLIDIFQKEIEEGKLLVIDGKILLENIDFYRLGRKLTNIDFTGFILRRCDFSNLLLQNCNFKDAIVERNCCVEGIWIVDLPPQNANPQLQAADDKEREDFWRAHYDNNYPQNSFTYDKVEPKKVSKKINKRALEKSKNSFSVKKKLFSKPHDNFSQPELGWKLHLSICPDDLSKAYDIAAPIISRYCKVFKVARQSYFAKRAPKSRFYFGAQITIYLEENGRPVMSAEQAAKMIAEVDSALKSAGIGVGIRPESDAPIIASEYFSLRNDKCDFRWLANRVASTETVPHDKYDDMWVKTTDSKEYISYLKAKFIGKSFNPTNVFNPFAVLIAPQPEFDLTKHFDSFNLKKAKYAKLVFQSSVLAWLNEFTCLMELTARDVIALKKQIFSPEEVLDQQFIKTNNLSLEVRKHAKFLIQLLGWCVVYAKDSSELTFISDCILGVDETAAALRYMADAIKKLNSSEKPIFLRASRCVPYSQFFSNAQTEFQLQNKQYDQAALIPCLVKDDNFLRERAWFYLYHLCLQNTHQNICDQKTTLSFMILLRLHWQFIEAKITMTLFYMKFLQVSELEFDALIKSIMSQYPSIEKGLAYNYFSDLLVILCRRPESLVDKLVELSVCGVAPAQYALALIRAKDVEFCGEELANKFGVIARIDLSRILISYHLAKVYLTKFLANPNRGVTGYEAAAKLCLFIVSQIDPAKKIIARAQIEKQHPYLLKPQASLEDVNGLRQTITQSPTISLS